MNSLRVASVSKYIVIHRDIAIDQARISSEISAGIILAEKASAFTGSAEAPACLELAAHAPLVG
jgi:hypothetical protein